MKRFKNILAVTADTVGSDEVLERAADLAAANGALLTVMDIDNDIYVSDTILEERQRKLDRMVQGWRPTASISAPRHAEGACSSKSLSRFYATATTW